MKPRITLRSLETVGFTMCVFCATLAGYIAHGASAGSAVNESSGTVQMEPVAFSGYRAVPDYLLTLSTGTKVLLEKLSDPWIPNGRLIVMDSNGTTRGISTKGPVDLMRCAGGKIYTLETIVSPAPKEVQALQDLLIAAGDYGTIVTPKMTKQIRTYDPASNTSATLRVLREPKQFLDLAPGDGCLYLFGSVFDKATSTSNIVITTLPLSAGVRETTSVIPNASGVYWPSNFIVRSGWLYYRAQLSTQTALADTFATYTVCRVNLATLERQEVLTDGLLASFCIAADGKSLVYLKEFDAGKSRAYVLKVVRLEKPSVLAAARVIDAMIGQLWYDEPEGCIMLLTENVKVNLSRMTKERALYRLRFSQ